MNWQNIKALTSRKGADGARLFLRQKTGESRAVTLEELRSLLLEWAKTDRGAAAKIALDYGQSRKTSGWIWIGGSLLFPGLLALLLMLDGLQTRHCNAVLENGQTAQAEVVKVTKNRRGTFVWKLRFKTADGVEVTGKRVPFTSDATGHAANDQSTTVVYAPSDLTCWDTSLTEGKNAPNMKNRRFNETLTLNFGWAFVLATIFGVLIGILRLAARPAYQAEVYEIGKSLL